MASVSKGQSDISDDIPKCTACDEFSHAVARCNDCEDNLCKTCLDSHKRLRALSKHRVTSIRLCPSCEESGKKVVAVAHCEDCNDTMCRMCLESHGRLRALKDHRVSSLDRRALNLVAPPVPAPVAAAGIRRHRYPSLKSNNGDKSNLLRRVAEFGGEGEVRVLAGRGIAVGPTGGVVIADCQGLKFFDGNGQIRFYFNMQQGFPTEKSQLTDAAVTREGQIIAADGTPNVKVFNPDGRFVRQFHAVSLDGKSSEETKSRLVAVTVDLHHNGNIFIGSGNKPYYISIHGAPQNGHHEATIKTSMEPRCIAVSPTGDKIAIGCWSEGVIHILSRSGELQHIAAELTHLKWLPVGVCWTPEEDMLITNVGSPGIGVYRFDSSGQLLGCVTEDVKYPWGIALKDKDGKEVVVADTESIKTFRWY